VLICTNLNKAENHDITLVVPWWPLLAKPTEEISEAHKRLATPQTRILALRDFFGLQAELPDAKVLRLTSKIVRKFHEPTMKPSL